VKVVPVKLSDQLTSALDELVKSGVYNSRNEALRDAVRFLIENVRLREVDERKRLQIELQVIARMVAAILLSKNRETISRIILFGSVAREDANEESDVDLLVIVRHGDRYHWRRKFIDELMPIMGHLGHYVSLKTFTEEEFEGLSKSGSPFFKEALSHAISIYGAEEGN